MENNSTQIVSHIVYEGVEFIAEYQDSDNFNKLDPNKVKQVYALCALRGRKSFILVHDQQKDSWGYPGGGKEKDETIEEGMRRELAEETEGLEAEIIKPIGYQIITDSVGNFQSIQVRYYCVVDSIDFDGYKLKKVNDPAGEVDLIRAIPLTWKNYFPNWGEIGNKIFDKAKYLNETLNY